MNSPQQIHPAEAGIRITFFRPIFGPERSGISQICKMRKDMLIIDVALVGPSASRNASKLDMANDVEICAQPTGQIAFQNLNMIAVEHQLQIGCANSIDDTTRLIRVVQEIAWRVNMIQRFDQEGDVALAGGGITQIVDKTTFRRLPFCTSRHHVNLRAVDQCGIGQRCINGGAGIIGASRKGGKPVLARRNIAARRVQPQHHEAGSFERSLHRAGIFRIGPVAFNRAKPGRTCRVDGIDKRPVSPQKPQIGRKGCHMFALPPCGGR